MKKFSTTTGPSAELLTIGALAKRIGFASSALRYYVEGGLIPPRPCAGRAGTVSIWNRRWAC
ncbi:MerR family transcriptional regulator [Acidovorax sp. LjRoot117]|uniref:MerR family transcriptional regulator n=1 Tax=Acidovorax sp. LjRoot117 TaxID=3342255 RepID=UPI003F50AA7D